MLRNCSKVRFGEAAARRRKVVSMSGKGRERRASFARFPKADFGCDAEKR